MERAFFDSETALLRQMTAEQKLRALDAIRRSAQLAAEIGVRLRQSASVRGGPGASTPSTRSTSPSGARRWLRVVTLEDGETVHNAFPHRNFQEPEA